MLDRRKKASTIQYQLRITDNRACQEMPISLSIYRLPNVAT